MPQTRKAESTINVRANDLAKAVYAQSEANAKKMFANYKREMRSANKRTVSAIDKMRKSWSQFAQGLQSSIAILGRVGRALGDMLDAKAGAQSLDIMRSFDRQVKNSAGSLLKLRAASKGTIDDTSLRKMALGWSRLGLQVQDSANLINLAYGAAT